MQRFAISILCLVAAADKESCSEKMTDQPLGGRTLLMKENPVSKKKTLLEVDEGHGKSDRSYGPYRSESALEYFMKWSQGTIASTRKRTLKLNMKLTTDPTLFETELQTEHSGQTTQRVASLFAAEELELCGNSTHRSWSLLEKTKTHGIEHLVLRSAGAAAAKFQYLAVQQGRILVADPPVACMVEQMTGGRTAVGDTYAWRVRNNIEAGGDALLDPKTDPLVKDCQKLFVRTAADICQKKLAVKAERATVQIIDGFKVNMEVKVTGPLGKVTHHSLSCLFELSLNHTDASLMQQEADPAETDPTESEKSGLKATLRMHSELCKADEENGANTGRFVKHVAFGELSFYKGFEHVNDDLARIEVPLKKGAATEVDHREMFPECFPLANGREVVRNQGTCGSCWAFAYASAAMNNLCTSNHGALSLASANDRFEVSVQQFMSCNDRQRGCNGGSVSHANEAIVNTNGLSKERDYSYRCGGGDPAQHFDQTDAKCESYPWGANCVESNSAAPGWMWSGVVWVAGTTFQSTVESMMAVIADGNSIYVSIQVYDNFFGLTNGVYDSQGLDWVGGHALVAMGYGTEKYSPMPGLQGQEIVKPYWLLQNSWGPEQWGVDGFGKFLRGSNLCEVESRAFWIKAWVSGGKEPECTDSPHVALRIDGERFEVPCTDVKNSSHGDLCAIAPFIKTYCPKTCNSCLVVGTPAPEQGPQGPTTPVPTPAPPITNCIDYEAWGGFSCVFRNRCQQKVNVTCPQYGCTIQVDPGPNGQYASCRYQGVSKSLELCAPGVCQE